MTTRYVFFHLLSRNTPADRVYVCIISSATLAHFFVYPIMVLLIKMDLRVGDRAYKCVHCTVGLDVTAVVQQLVEDRVTQQMV